MVKKDDKPASGAAHEALLKKLSARTRGRALGVVLTPDEMEALRQLSSLAPSREPEAPPRPRRTRDLKISVEERGVLSDIARGQATEGAGASRPRPRTTEIQLSSAELEYLRRLSFDRAETSGPGIGVQERLRSAPRAPRRPITLELTHAELRWLARATGSPEHSLTDAERAALRALHEKLRGGTPR